MLTRIHHLSLVVADFNAAKRLWTDTYGFGVDESSVPAYDGTHSHQSINIRVGGSDLQITQPEEEGSGTSRFLATRGPGPHHLCLSTDDMDEDIGRLQAGGLRLLGQPRGDLRDEGGHRVAFFHPRENLGFLLELRQDSNADGQQPQPPRGRGGGITRIHHVGFVAPSIEEAAHLFCDIYGLKVDDSLSPLPGGRLAPQDNVRVLDIPIGESELEVVIPQDASSGTARYLATRGPGIHHLCLNSEDIEHDMGRLQAAGLQEIGAVSEGRDGAGLVGWLHPRSNMGLLVEVWQDVR